jgi:acetylornithine/N-succinyldiaminopimelate aminotransferase
MTRLLWIPGHVLQLTDIVRARNCDLHDSEGNRYVDLESGIWCTVLGHAHPRILDVLARQSAAVAHTGYAYSSPVVDETAAEILDLLRFEGGGCVFLCSGSEAVEYGVRAAQALAPRPLLLTMTDSYFGAYGSARSRRPEEWFSFDWSPCAGCPDGASCGDDCASWRRIPFRAIGGFLFEPGSSSGLVRFPPRKLIEAIVAKIRESDGFILVNEVTTGIGRTGKWFGFEHYGFSPDVVALGKGLGNGYPVSVAAFARDAFERLKERPVAYSQSHQNDPLGASVAREVLRVIREEGLVSRAEEIGGILASGLASLQAQVPHIREIRSRGLMIAVELEDGPGAPMTARVQRKLLHRGFIIAQRPGLNVLRIDPALTVERADIDAFLETFGEVLRDLDGGGPDG